MGDIVRRQAVGVHEIEHRVDRRMGAAAARIALDGDAGRDDVERLRPVAQHRVGVVIAGAVEDLEEALPVLEHVVARGHALARQQSPPSRRCWAQWPTCSGLVMVPKLALRPDENEAAMASAVAVCAAVSPSSREAAAAAPNTPSVAVGCQPLS